MRLREQTLFDTSVRLPANLTEGVYLTRIFLTRGGGGRVVDVFDNSDPGRKFGAAERLIYHAGDELL